MRGSIAAALTAVAAVVGLAILSGFTAHTNAFKGTVYIGMDAPLTGPTQIVGTGDREAVLALARYWNARGGINGRRIVVDVRDNASNPSQAVQNVQQFVADRKYVAILGSGNAAAAVATSSLATAGQIPFLPLSPPTIVVAPPRPYVYVALPTSRLYAYSAAKYLRSKGIKRVAVMGDNGGFGRDGPVQVGALAKAYGLTITDEIIFSPASTNFTAELTKVKNSDAQALWLWTVTPAGNTIVKEMKELQLPQQLVLTGGNMSDPFLQGTCPDANGAIINGYLGNVWKMLPKTNPVRAQAAIAEKAIGHPLSVFNVDAATAFFALKAAMERGGFTRKGIDKALETKMKGVVTPGGRLRLVEEPHRASAREHVGRDDHGGKPKPLTGAAFDKKKK